MQVGRQGVYELEEWEGNEYKEETMVALAGLAFRTKVSRVYLFRLSQKKVCLELFGLPGRTIEKGSC